MFLALSQHENNRKKIFVDRQVFGTTIEVIKTKAHFVEAEVVVGDWKELKK